MRLIMMEIWRPSHCKVKILWTWHDVKSCFFWHFVGIMLLQKRSMMIHVDQIKANCSPCQWASMFQMPKAFALLFWRTSQWFSPSILEVEHVEPQHTEVKKHWSSARLKNRLALSTSSTSSSPERRIQNFLSWPYPFGVVISTYFHCFDRHFPETCWAVSARFLRREAGETLAILARSTGVSKNALFFEQRQKFPCDTFSTFRSGSKWYQEMDRNGSCLWTLSWTYPFFMVWMLPCWVNGLWGASSRLQTNRVAAKLCAASEKPIVTSSRMKILLQTPFFENASSNRKRCHCSW